MQDTQLLLMAANNNRTASANGAGLDLTVNNVGGFNPGEGGVPVQCLIPIISIAHPGTGETYQFKLQDSPDNATWTDISANRAASDYGGPNSAGAGGKVYVGGFVRQQYVRLVVTLAGTAPVLNHGDIYLQAEPEVYG